MFRLICLVIGYCIGCIETAYVVGKLWRVDLRKHGSGNLGTTNTLRVLGKKAGAIVFIGDILKSVIAFMLCRAVFADHGTVAGLCGSAGAVLGHNFPFYLNFKGGKGISTSAAVIFMLDWRVGIIVLVGALLVMVLTRYISLGSMVGALLFPTSVCLFTFFVDKDYNYILLVKCFNRHCY